MLSLASHLRGPRRNGGFRPSQISTKNGGVVVDANGAPGCRGRFNGARRDGTFNRAVAAESSALAFRSEGFAARHRTLLDPLDNSRPRILEPAGFIINPRPPDAVHPHPLPPFRLLRPAAARLLSLLLFPTSESCQHEIPT